MSSAAALVDCCARSPAARGYVRQIQLHDDLGASAAGVVWLRSRAQSSGNCARHGHLHCGAWRCKQPPALWLCSLSRAQRAQDQDICISAWGTGSQWSSFAARLDPARNGGRGGPLRLLHIDADHQGMLTHGVNVARAIATATAIDREVPLGGTAAGAPPMSAELDGRVEDAGHASDAQVAAAAGKGQALSALLSGVTLQGGTQNATSGG